MAESKQYYALHISSEPDHDPRVERRVPGSDVAFIDIGFDKELHSTIRAIAVYTLENGHAQDHDLEGYAGTTSRPVSAENLLHVLDLGYPNAVFLDGRKLAASVFKGMLKTELGLPIRNPRLIRLDDPAL